MTRRGILSRARKIETAIDKAWRLMHEIRDSGHPQAEELYETLKEELGITSTSVLSVVEQVLESN